MKIGLAENILIGISEDTVLKTHKITIYFYYFYF